MQTLTKETFETLLGQTDIKPRIKKSLKFVASTNYLGDDWSDRELLAVADRTGDAGVLLVQPDGGLYMTPYELSRRIVDSATGRERAIVCDLCYTWQPGSGAASITFRQQGASHSITLLCCADLRCSQHVRTTTNAGRVSRTQLRESLDNDRRAARLRQRLMDLVERLELTAVRE